MDTQTQRLARELQKARTEIAALEAERARVGALLTRLWAAREFAYQAIAEYSSTDPERRWAEKQVRLSEEALATVEVSDAEWDTAFEELWDEREAKQAGWKRLRAEATLRPKMGRPPKPAPPWLQEAVRLRNEGVATKDLATRFKVDVKRMHYLLKTAGADLSRRVWNVEARDRMREKVLAGR